MFEIFNYNSRKFTILAICFICGLFYFNERNNFKSSGTPNAEGAKYTLEIDPAILNKDKTTYQKILYFLFGEQINKTIDNKKVKSNSISGNAISNYKIKSGDKVSIVYYQTNPLPSVLPKPIQVIVGNNNLPPPIDSSIIGMSSGNKKEVIIGNNFYDVLIFSVE